MGSLRGAGFALLMSFLCCLPTAPLGALARHAGRKDPKGWKVTVYSCIIAVLFWWVALSANTYGDMTLGLLSYAVAGFPLGAAIYGLILWLRCGFNNSKDSSEEKREE